MNWLKQWWAALWAMPDVYWIHLQIHAGKLGHTRVPPFVTARLSGPRPPANDSEWGFVGDNADMAVGGALLWLSNNDRLRDPVLIHIPPNCPPRCFKVPPPPGYLPCTREPHHAGPCAHPLDYGGQ